ncbi:MAG TPA: class I SAM-dependent methyltransferase [Solirubrobacteraceae bacterium]|nr:class I SAM-dependent methyltransferase [Solirubrobacteraceae bacterium]
MSVYGDLVAEHGLSAAHRLLLAAVPPGARVLDAGCASGYLAGLLVARGHEVTGIEADPAAAQAAREQAGVDVLTGDLERPEDLARLRGPYGVVVLGDVLEHLRDPARVLRALRPLLAPDGLLVASLPNAVHWTARREILRGRFPQTDHGLFDRTHLHFYTRASARELLSGAGYRVLGEQPVPAPLPLEAHMPLPAGLREAAVRAAPGLLALQFVFRARPAGDLACGRAA